MLESIRRKAIGVCACAALAVLFGSVSVAGAASDYMLIDSARLNSLPTSGAPYTYVKKIADSAMANMDLSEPASSKSPWLSNQSSSSAWGSETLAAALVYARTGDTRYRDFVIRVNRFVIGSEQEPSTDGTSSKGALLATMRQISAYVLAADLVRMDRAVTGSRNGYGRYVWHSWLGSLRTKVIGTSSNKKTIVDLNRHATNWGAWASASRVTIDAYLGDEIDLAAAVERFKLYLGESHEGEPWIRSSSYDDSWACHPAGVKTAFIPINPPDCGVSKDGIVVEDASRSSHTFPTWDDSGIDYSFHAAGAQMTAAIILSRRGHDAWNWGRQGLKRLMDRLDRLGVASGNGRSTARHVSWIARYFYGIDYPTAAASVSHTLAFTDWLYPELGGGVTDSPPEPQTAPEPEPAVVMGDSVAGSLATKMSVDAKRGSAFQLNAAATVTSLKAHIDGRGKTSGSQPVRAIVYADNAGAPGARIASSQQVVIVAGQRAGWIDFPLSSSPSLPAGRYWLALHSGRSSAVGRYSARSVVGALRYGSTGSDLYSDGASTSFGFTRIDNKRMSIYAVGR